MENPNPGRVLTPQQLELLEQHIGSLALSLRTINSLESMDIMLVRELLMTQPEVIRAKANIGEKTMEEIYAALAAHGLYRSGVPQPEAAAPKTAIVKNQQPRRPLRSHKPKVGRSFENRLR